MIQSIKLSNFQSHEETSFNFHPGVNSIIGSSNSGKTSVLRGLYWVLNNRPSGQAFISHWNQTKKGVPIESTKVTIKLENHTISRGRDKNFNGYAINDKILEAIGTDVPEEVTLAFNLGEVNIQKQMDAPFLLSESAGGVARFFNREIRLDLIDRILSSAESMRRSTVQNIQTIESQIEKLEDDLAGLKWTPTAEEILQKAEKVNFGIGARKQQVEVLSETIQSFSHYHLIIEKNNAVIPAQSLILSIDELNVSIADTEYKVSALSHSIDSYKRQKANIDKIPDISKAETACVKIKDVQESVEEKNSLIHNLAKSIDAYNSQTAKIIQASENIKEYTEQLPNICPLCGGAI